MNNKEKGNIGERIAANYLEKKGYAILAKNFRIAHGEIDIIAQINKDIHFVEVKLRKNRDFGEAHLAVNKKKQITIRVVANEFLKQYGVNFDEICFDVVEIYTEDKLVNFIEKAF